MMKSFINSLLRFSLAGILFLAISGILYFNYDPFKVLYKYDSYIETNVPLNRGFISTMTYIKNKQNYDYNSFIFGNSRALVYRISDWKKVLPNSTVCFHFDAFNESLLGIEKKLDYIVKSGHKIDHALFIIDYFALSQTQLPTGHLFVMPPELLDNANFFEFHKTFFLAFINPKFLYAYFNYKLSGKPSSNMQKNVLFENLPQSYDVISNELNFDSLENTIHKNETDYYLRRQHSIFYKQDTTIQKYYPQSIFKQQQIILTHIAQILRNNHTHFKVIINPLYDQIKLNALDKDYLCTLFGTENVFDFSGINSITKNYKNYYEPSHYRPLVAKVIIDSIYQPKTLVP